MAHEVFISYSSKDKSVADAMCYTLEANGLRCWIAPRDILPGMDWGSSIIDAIATCRVMVLLLTSNSNASSQVRREVERAVNKEVIIIPFRIEDVRLSKSLEYHLSVTHWMDALTPPLESHLWMLAEKVKQLLSAHSEMRSVPIQPVRPTQKRLALFLGSGLVVALIALVGLVLWLRQSNQRAETTTPAPTPTSQTSLPQNEQSDVTEKKAATNQNQSMSNNSASDTSGQLSVPKIYGKTYDVAREILIKDGWQPNKLHWTHGESVDVQNGNGPIFWKRDYWELVSCSGTGSAQCLFEFFDPSQRVLVVVTEGEEAEDGEYHATVNRVFLKSK